MTLVVRRLDPAEAAASRQLGFEAFGVPATTPSDPPAEQPGAVSYGAFDEHTLVARLRDRAYDSYFGGTSVATCGVAGVTVAMEYRGRGAVRALFAEMLAEAKARGAAISTLFPTAPGIYRGLGYEMIADYATVAVPTAVLGAVPRPATVTTRRATAGDVDAIQEVYDGWAAQQNGPLSRRGASFPGEPADFLGSFTGVTLALDADGQICGYASWERGEGYGERAVLEVSDLLASTADGYRALLSGLGSFSPVTPTTRIDTSGDDLVRLFLPSLPWRPVESRPYMLKILDVPAALTAPRYPRGVYAQLGFRLAGDFLGENDGSYLLQVADGASACDRVAEQDDRVVTPQGLALLYAGAQSCANLRFAGHLAGGDREQDLLWDALFGGRQVHIRDYF